MVVRSGGWRCVFARCMCVVMIALPFVTNGQEGTSSQTRFRKYSDGRLTAADFRAAKPRDTQGDSDEHRTAFTVVEIRYDLKYEITAIGTEIGLVLREIEVFAAMNPHKSWNERKFDKELLDHEQGHFDITQAGALAAQLQFAELLRSGRPPIGRGIDRNAAAADLQQRIAKIIDAHGNAAIEQNKEYDRLTRHGTLPEPQAEQRKQQLARLEELRAKLKELNDN